MNITVLTAKPVRIKKDVHRLNFAVADDEYGNEYVVYSIEDGFLQERYEPDIIDYTLFPLFLPIDYFFEYMWNNRGFYNSKNIKGAMQLDSKGAKLIGFEIIKKMQR